MKMFCVTWEKAFIFFFGKIAKTLFHTENLKEKLAAPCKKSVDSVIRTR